MYQLLEPTNIRFFYGIVKYVPLKSYLRYLGHCNIIAVTAQAPIING